MRLLKPIVRTPEDGCDSASLEVDCLVQGLVSGLVSGSSFSSVFLPVSLRFDLRPSILFPVAWFLFLHWLTLTPSVTPGSSRL